jgi:N-acetylglucosamine kinase-like BadF-type ATPase
MNFVLGLDGGNTKTIALVAALDGTVVGVGRGGCSDIYTNPDPAVPLSEAEHAVTQALDMAGVTPDQLTVGAFSMAGADWPEDFAFLQFTMQQRGYGRQITVVNDAVGALRAGLIDEPGVVVACGTGAATAARSADGRVWHSSWWQDTQGGHQLGVKTINAAYRAELGIDPPIALTTAVLHHFGQDTIEGVLHLFTARVGRRPAKQQVSSLAPILLDLADAGDPTARRIVQEHGESLGDYALAAARQVGIEGTSFTLALTGGVLRHHSRLLPEALIARVHISSPDAKPVYSRFEPVVGALFIALEAAGVSVDDALLARLTESLPDSSLFAT